MIFANHWVAKKISSSLPTSALLRRHHPPSQNRFSHLRTCAGVKGFKILTGDNRELAESLDRANDPQDPEINKVNSTCTYIHIFTCIYVYTCIQDINAFLCSVHVYYVYMYILMDNYVCTSVYVTYYVYIHVATSFCILDNS